MLTAGTASGPAMSWASFVQEVRHFATEAEKYELALRLNCRRRQLNRKQKQALIEVYLRCDPQIADNYLADLIGGISQNTVAQVRERLIATFQIEKFDKLRGRDGKQRPTQYKRIVTNSAKEAEAAQKHIADLPESCNGKCIDTTTAKRRAARERNKKKRKEQVEKCMNLHDIKLYHCRFQDLEAIAGIAPGQAKLVLTDIPYDQSFLPQVADLGAFSARVLAEGGLLVTLCGQYWLHKVLAMLGEHLTYRWINASVWDGDATPIHIGGWKEPHARVVSKWKPILVFSKGGFPRRGQWCDVSRISAVKKKTGTSGNSRSVKLRCWSAISAIQGTLSSIPAVVVSPRPLRVIGWAVAALLAIAMRLLLRAGNRGFWRSSGRPTEPMAARRAKWTVMNKQLVERLTNRMSQKP